MIDAKELDDVLRTNKSREWLRLSDRFLNARLRSDRDYPASSTDITAKDAVNDVVIGNAGIAWLYFNSGAPEWRQIAWSSF